MEPSNDMENVKDLSALARKYAQFFADQDWCKDASTDTIVQIAMQAAVDENAEYRSARLERGLGRMSELI